VLFVFSTSAIAEETGGGGFLEIVKETWWLVFLIPVTFFLKRYLDKLDGNSP
jgi:hypothetical protein